MSVAKGDLQTDRRQRDMKFYPEGKFSRCGNILKQLIYILKLVYVHFFTPVEKKFYKLFSL